MCEFFDEKVIQDKEFNDFKTYDVLLRLEVYNMSILNQIEKFSYKYKEFISSRAETLKITMLPLVIGIFQVRVMNITNIIVMSRHPYSFQQFHSFKHWIQMSFNDKKIKDTFFNKRLMIDKIIPCEELALKENLFLSNEEFNRFELTIKRDLKFISSLDFFPGIKFNIFIINDQYENNRNSIFKENSPDQGPFERISKLSTVSKHNSKDLNELIERFSDVFKGQGEDKTEGKKSKIGRNSNNSKKSTHSNNDFNIIKNVFPNKHSLSSGRKSNTSKYSCDEEKLEVPNLRLSK
jgi:hypothetical protein